MSKDSSCTYIHMHHPRLADLFEDFTRPHTSLSSNLAAAASQQHGASSTGPGGTTVTYGAMGNQSTMYPSFLPVEEIYVPPQYQPINPEDEDDVVPDQHAAFGIARAMDSVGRRSEPAWRDLGLQELVRGARYFGGNRLGMQGIGAGGGAGASAAFGGVAGAGRPGDPAPTTAVRLRLKGSGAMMGGRRVACLR
ncbi:Apc13p protein-domain-containing protein [Talaromyces proteolyticus]|uniref:Apc13p protein-domain-containing protein n=1 Tax=Talaromyces proteolyticus TaxID=1131652 RepID=A0AAD4L1F5_9EURO|nr:Apc13p protein-domain-containing protein [Talaromyces proteolyticus]KAH8705374.1 Apc13p protein-domain-containing protein [Talaromyces proteolyticus]